MSTTPVRQREKAYSQSSSGTLGLGLLSKGTLWNNARIDAKRGVPVLVQAGTIDWNTVPTWTTELSNATKLARMTVLGLLISCRAELREYDALVARLAVENRLLASVAGGEREELVEQTRRIARNIASIERQLPGLEAHLSNAIREATSWGDLFFDAADHRVSYYWRVLRRRHPQGKQFGDARPTLPRPTWLSSFSLEDLLSLDEDESLATDPGAAGEEEDRA